MGPGEHRPNDEEYWTSAWSTVLFAGDLFEAIPFGDQPLAVHTDEEGSGKHFLGEIAFAFGLLITPTCDMAEQHSGSGAAHPYRVLVPVLPLAAVAAETEALEQSLGLVRGRDAVGAYMYLPPLAGAFEDESVACLFRPTLVSDELLAEPPRRIAQLQPIARRHLKVKLAHYWGRVIVDPTELPLEERNESQLRAPGWPPSRYDPER